MRVHELKSGTRFRILKKIYVLYTVSPCAALVELETGPRDVKIGDASFQVAGGRRIHIAPNAEVDEILGTVELKDRVAKKTVDELEEARLAIKRAERKEAAKAAEEAA